MELPTKMGQPVDCDGGLCRREDKRGDRVEGEDREEVGEKAEDRNGEEEEGGWEDGSEKHERLDG